jgi:hypothetical protein
VEPLILSVCDTVQQIVLAKSSKFESNQTCRFNNQFTGSTGRGHSEIAKGSQNATSIRFIFQQIKKKRLRSNTSTNFKL